MLETSFQLFGNKDIITNKQLVSMTIGNFDGVHSGHRFLIMELKKLSPNIPLIVMTFDPHPANLFQPQNPKTILTSIQEKIRLLLEAGVDTIFVQNFNRDFSQLTADDFCNWLKNKFNIGTLLLGHDFCYGKGRQGNFEHMKNFAKSTNWNITQASAFKFINNEIVSSSLIRETLSKGELEKAELLLSRPYFISGIVVRGDGRGRQIGFPTANIKIDDNYVIPKFGVYACYVEINNNKKLLPGVMNCGIRPTISNDPKLQIEAHIFNFSSDIYDQTIKFHIKKFIRGEKKFNNVEQLKEQIFQDAQITETYLLGSLNA